MRRQLEGSSGGERGFDFGGTATQEFVAVDGLSNQVMASNLSALNCSLAEGVTRRSTVDDSANILARYMSTFSTGSLRASMSDFDHGVRNGDRAELCFWWDCAAGSRQSDLAVKYCYSPQLD